MKIGCPTASGARKHLIRLLRVMIATLALLAAPATAALASTISGRAFEDLNRDGVWQSTEPALSGQQLYLFDSAGNYLAQAYTDVNGQYAFTGLADGSYRVQYASPSWWNLRENWVPDTTGSIDPVINLQLATAAEADFGWRQIVRSTTIGSPITSYVGPNGLTVQSYDDVIDAKTIYDKLTSGTVGGEAPYTTVRFDIGSSSTTSTSFTQTNGIYTGYQAVSYVTYDSWMDTGDVTLAHEYGHSWAHYYAYIVQQDPTLGGYLQERGLSGNPNLDTSTAWDRWEIVADDYRQLLGPPDARSAPQMNTSIPNAADVPGLQNYLANVFTQPPAPVNSVPPAISGNPAVGVALTCSQGSWSGSPSFGYAWNRDGAPIAGASSQTYTPVPADAGHSLTCSVTATDSAGSTTVTSAAAPVPALSVTNVVMSPTPVKSSGTASFVLSEPASVTVAILTSSGSLVRTLLSGASEPAGAVTATWNRTNSAGQRAKTGTYTLRVTASAGAASTTASQSFSVS